SADWKFVVVHQPAFNSDWKYRFEQRIRLIYDILQEGGVDIVFSGHCHYYERHRPVVFKPTADRPAEDGTVSGTMTIDHDFDGERNRRPKGVLSIVTGAGGQTVSDEARRSPDDYSETTVKLIDDRRSFTVLDTDGKVLTLRQISDKNEEVDRLVIDKR